MPVIPAGFTPITSDYTPFDPPPDISGLQEGTPTLLLDGYITVPTGEEPPPILQIEPTSSDLQRILTLRSGTTYVRAGERLQLTGNVTDLSRQPVRSGTALLRLLRTNTITDLPAKAIAAQVESGEVIFNIHIGSNTEVGAGLQFAFYLAASAELPPLSIDDQELQSTQVSNTVTVRVLASTSQAAVEPPTPPGVPVVPIHDVLVTQIGKTLRTHTTEEIIDLAPTNQAPRGSSGRGIYKDVGIPSPANASMHSSKPSEGVDRLLGMTLDQLKRLSGWANKILYLIHSDKSPLPNSELRLLKLLLPADVGNAIDRYAALLGESGKYATDIASAYAPDYANGNTITKSNAVQQFNVGQFRTQTTSVFDVNSPSINQASQQHVVQTRFEHHAADLYQGSHTHFYVRAEDQLTLMANSATRFNTGDLMEVSANERRYAGNSVIYSDTVFEQVGQITNIPLHPLRSRSLTDYGYATKLVMRDYYVKSLLGEVSTDAFRHVHMTARTGNVQLAALTGSIGMRAVNSITGNAINRIAFHSLGMLSLGSASTVRVGTLAPLLLNGSVVLINSGAAGVQVPRLIAPRIISTLPTVVRPMADPAPYVKTPPVSPGAVGQKTPMTPEPNASSGGAANLGSYLTGPKK